MNCAALVCGDTTIAIDCGIGFTDEHGAELVHPDFDWLFEERERLRAIVITHGHEDHIGALPYFLQEVRVPVYAPPYAAALIEDRLRELLAPREVARTRQRVLRRLREGIYPLPGDGWPSLPWPAF